MTNFFDAIVPVFTMLFVVVDPIGNMPIFMSITESPRLGYRPLMAKRACIIGFLVLIFFAFVGEAFLKALGISLQAFRIAGGIMLFIVALQMIFENEQHEKNVEETAGNFENDVSVFPLAIPLIAGPGSIASIILLMSERHGDISRQLIVVAALAAVLLISYLLFRLSGAFARLFGQTINTVISKILGIILGAMAAQFIIDGISSLLRR